jgi:antirestriction protein ArdC
VSFSARWIRENVRPCAMAALKRTADPRWRVDPWSASEPARQMYKGADHFYNVAFHELAHWTGHKSRLDRDLKNRFGSRSYAAEELIAELSAAFLCAEFGFDGDLRSAGYIGNWIELLKADKRAFFTACSHASKAADYLRGLALAEPSERAA